MWKGYRMVLTFDKKSEENQTADFHAQMSNAELNFLINFAIQSLMQIGAITVNDMTQEPQEVALPITETLLPPSQVQ